MNKPLRAQVLYGTITRRLMPLLFLSYLFAFLDRINISYAQLQMKSLLGFSDAVYGFGAGIFFISYVLFEIPSNLWMARSGIRFTLLRIMTLWGLTSIATMFVRTPGQFYLARFLLGMFESGFFPGIVLYLTFWFPAVRRARATSLFMLAMPVAGLVGSPLSGWIMLHMNTKCNLAGWQWMLLLEGIPAPALGILCFFLLPDVPSEAVWLSDSEKAFLAENLATETENTKSKILPSTSPKLINPGIVLFRDRQVWALGIVYFAIACANYGFTFWLPTLLKAAGVMSIAQIGWLSAIPYCFATAGAVTIAWSSDRQNERRCHVAGTLTVAAVALACCSLVHTSIPLIIMLLSLMAFCLFGGGILFWTIPSTYLKGNRAPAGIAIVSSMGVIGGFVSPTFLGWIKAHTGRFDVGNLCICLLMMAAAVTIVLADPTRYDRSSTPVK